jgi:hypothetical protein
MTPTERILAALAEHDCPARQAGSGWSARCPAHDDRRASLSLSTGDDGVALLHCHAGCDTAAVCESMRLTLADLMPDGRPAKGKDSRPKQSKPTKPKPAKRKPTLYPSARDAIAELERRQGKRSATWTYHDANVEPVGVVVRWDIPGGGKDIRPVAKVNGGWVIGGIPEPRPLYRLPELVAANRVYVTEGEKAADAARSIGLVATTSPHGSQSAAKADWQPLAGKQVIILPDNDDAGADFAGDVVELLGKVSPAATVSIVELPGLPAKGDMADYVAANADCSTDELRRQVEAMADTAEPEGLPPPAEPPARYQPFPVEVLPEPMRSLVVEGAAAIDCDAAYVALPTLSVIAAAIGNTRRVRCKAGWTEPAILWTVIIGESGTTKSPAIDLALSATARLQELAMVEHTEAAEQYKIKRLTYERDLAAWKKGKKDNGLPPWEPDTPVATRYAVNDQTLEALAMLLHRQPRGLLLARDELAGWLSGFDKYSKGKGDASQWLELHGGRSITIDRKTGEPKTLYIPRAAVSVCGGIQPGTLQRCLTTEHRQSGLAARLLLAYPPRRPKRWTEAEIDTATTQAMREAIDRLHGLDFAVNADNQPTPKLVHLTPEAKALYVAYTDAHNAEQYQLHGDIAAAYSKLEGAAARLALVVHYARWAGEDATLANADAVDAESMQAGIKLARWFAAEAKRVYAMLDESEEGAELRKLADWIAARGGSVTVRDVQQGHRQYRTSAEAEAALDALVQSGIGSWEIVPTATKPKQVFTLPTCLPSTDSPSSQQIQRNVDVDSVDTPKTQPDDDWGEV